MKIKSYKTVIVEEEGKSLRYDESREWLYKEIDNLHAKRICMKTGRIELVEIKERDQSTDFESVYDRFYQNPIERVEIENLPDDETILQLVRGVLINLEEINVSSVSDEIGQKKLGLDVCTLHHEYSKYAVLGYVTHDTHSGIVAIEDALINKGLSHDETIKRDLKQLNFTDEDIERIGIKTYVVGYHFY